MLIEINDADYTNDSEYIIKLFYYITTIVITSVIMIIVNMS